MDIYSYLSDNLESNMEWPIESIIFQRIVDNFELSLWFKVMTSVCSILILISGLLVHQRVLSFLKNNDGRHVDQIIGKSKH